MEPAHTETAVAIREQNEMVRPMVKSQDLIGYQTEVIEYIKSTLHEGVDYGPIPGTNSDVKVLKKPGAELLCKSAYLIPEFEIMSKEIDHDRRVTWEKVKYGKVTSGDALGLYNYVIKCKLFTPQGNKAGEGIGSCSTMESKYITRPRDSENTVLKMAKKRAFVDATLTAFSLSGRFTQDVEDAEVSSGDSKPAASNRQERAGVRSDTPASATVGNTPGKQVRLYTGTTQEQEAVQAILKKNNIPEEAWIKFHDNLLNKPGFELPNLIKEYRAHVAAMGEKENHTIDASGEIPLGSSEYDGVLGSNSQERA